MAHFELEATRVSIHLKPMDEILALHTSLHLPYRHIRAIRWEIIPEEWFNPQGFHNRNTYKGFRIGTYIPGIVLAGAFHNGDGVVFYDFHNPDRCLTFDLAHEHFRHVVVQVDGDQDIKHLLNAIAERLPNGPGA